MSGDGSFEDLVSYGHLIGLRVALACRDRTQIEECIAEIEKYRDKKFPTDAARLTGNAEYQSWRVEREMQMWQRDSECLQTDRACLQIPNGALNK